jgi:nucleotide-binding universal stress UspA family protein
MNMKETYDEIILIPTDFSEVCDNAINHGAEIAKSLNYRVAILHVVDKKTKTMLKKEEAGVELVEKKLNEIKEKYESQYQVHIDAIVREGSIFEVIHKVAEEIKAKLVVLGTHGKSGLQYLFGSFALRVVLESPVPVIVVQKRSFGKGYHEIVFPVSSDMEPRQKVSWALFISKLFKSRIHIFQSLENDPGLNTRLQIITKQITDVLVENNVPYTLDVADKTGDFAKQVIGKAAAIHADMIMIMTLPNMDSPGFRFSAWDETMMFNEAQVPVMCINPVILGGYYYDLPGM